MCHDCGSSTVARTLTLTPYLFNPVYCGVSNAVRARLYWDASSCFRQLERADREAEVTFGQLGFFAYNMVKFDVPGDSVRSLMEKYSRFANSSKSEWEALVQQVCAVHALTPGVPGQWNGASEQSRGLALGSRLSACVRLSGEYVHPRQRRRARRAPCCWKNYIAIQIVGAPCSMRELS